MNLITAAAAFLSQRNAQILKIKWIFELNGAWLILNKDKIAQQCVEIINHQAFVVMSHKH